MAKKKSDRAVKTLTAKLEKSEAKVERWKAKAKRLQDEADDSAKQVKKLRKRLEADRSSPEPASATPNGRRTSDAPAASSAPDGSWTVARLRIEARDRGISGYSRKSKDELVRLLGE